MVFQIEIKLEDILLLQDTFTLDILGILDTFETFDILATFETLETFGALEAPFWSFSSLCGDFLQKVRQEHILVMRDSQYRIKRYRAKQMLKVKERTSNQSLTSL